MTWQIVAFQEHAVVLENTEGRRWELLVPDTIGNERRIAANALVDLLNGRVPNTSHVPVRLNVETVLQALPREPTSAQLTSAIERISQVIYDCPGPDLPDTYSGPGAAGWSEMGANADELVPDELRSLGDPAIFAHVARNNSDGLWYGWVHVAPKAPDQPEILPVASGCKTEGEVIHYVAGAVRALGLMLRGKPGELARKLNDAERALEHLRRQTRDQKEAMAS